MVFIFTLLIVYQLKHFIADYPLQANEFMLGKFKPGWDWVVPLTAHCFVHTTFTVFIAVTVCDDSTFALQLGALDFVMHFIMDRIKAHPRLMGRWKPLYGEDYTNTVATVKARQLQFKQHAPNFFDVPEATLDDITAHKKFWGNKFFWISLGFDQMVHHLTHYGLVYLMYLKVS